MKVKVIYQNKVDLFVVEPGTNLLDAIRKRGYLLNALCGGKGTCKKCQVIENEKTILACQTFVTKDTTITIDIGEAKILIDSTVTNEKLASPQASNHSFGVAVDIGTTTVAGYLINLDTLEETDRYAGINYQASYGADVITRIEQCSRGKLNEIHQAIITQLNDMIRKFKLNNNIETVDKLFVAGNTTMSHLLAGVDPTPLGVVPFEPVFVATKYLKGEEINLDARRVIILPSISAYLGSDILAGIIPSQMLEKSGNILLVDIGTNGEIILKTDDLIYGCSTAAGPAFEGAKIACGMSALRGAIDQVRFDNNQLSISTIGGDPIGICGSGLVDIIAILVKCGIIDDMGAFNYDSNSILRPYLKNDRFFITDKVYITQKDIREFQLAKSAIHAGIQSLIEVAGLNINEIDYLFLAGGFGFYLNLKNAISTGLLPKELLDKIVTIGNASGQGAKMCLINPNYLRVCEEISKTIKVIELSNLNIFMEYFVDKMMF